MPLPNTLRIAQLLLDEHLENGDLAIDATIGSGYDTAFLAERVGPEGRVYGFDVQIEARERTSRRLAELQLEDRVVLFTTGHEHMRDVLPDDVHGQVAACMFNLGYLPGGDKQIITRPSTTIQALATAIDVLKPRGIITAVLYPGHPGGYEETEAVVDWARSIPKSAALFSRFYSLNDSEYPPELVVVEKRT